MGFDRIELTIPHASDFVRYSIVIGNNSLSQLPSLIDCTRYSKILFLVDLRICSVVEPIISALGLPQAFVQPVETGEHNKTFTSLEQLLGIFQAAHLDRRSLVVNVGGGMLGDFGGFAASIYMRGIDFIQVPTTLLAQVDASVGGKVAINFGGIKNLIGAFQQPKLVLIDTQFLSSLPPRELYSGFAEVLKHGLIFDRDFVFLLEELASKALVSTDYARIIKRNCEIKGQIVEQDPFEMNIRKTLNFGHTVGHAIESLAAETESHLLHGECVALGMLAEGYVATQMGRVSMDELQRIRALIKAYKLPDSLTASLTTEALLKKTLHDKKNSGGTIFLALLSGIGSCDPKIEVTTTQLSDAINYIRG